MKEHLEVVHGRLNVSAYIHLIYCTQIMEDGYVVITSYFSKMEQATMLLAAQKPGLGGKILKLAHSHCKARPEPIEHTWEEIR